jgi:hypothetical protein
LGVIDRAPIPVSAGTPGAGRDRRGARLTTRSYESVVEAASRLWPNGEFHTRDKEGPDRARDGRDREHVRRGGGAPEATVRAIGAL